VIISIAASALPAGAVVPALQPLSEADSAAVAATAAAGKPPRLFLISCPSLSESGRFQI
jgi:hypothetical protein